MNLSHKIVHAAFPPAYTGKSIGVAVLDTGIYPHPDFLYPSNRIAIFKDFLHHRNSCYDDNGHGTHVCGIIGGSGHMSDGRYAGMAPECHLIVGKVLDSNGNGSVRHILQAIRWIIDIRLVYNIRILNISVGSENTDVDEEKSILVQCVNEAWDSGIVVVAAAGNNGPRRMSVTSPGISRKVITVGSSDDQKTIYYNGVRINNYSGRGPTRRLVPKPDIVAPGSNIISCSPPFFSEQGGYAGRSGTSMSTPIVSGAAALLLSKEPDMTNEEVKKCIQMTATDLHLPRNQQGFGLLNVEKMLKNSHRYHQPD
ncbi:MAG TPA: S8 family peptidase [Candidatus Onthocola gallistercoris]|uniref:S8 family peptidase n=1 Tax=Candidatus Onthocola gallistercoris TaxID=2840876 RepID=A0A9D1HFE5_9FIRM|nr:S8 family peptidase [Candidatus Onthocola gallistercoris]